MSYIHAEKQGLGSRKDGPAVETQDSGGPGSIPNSITGVLYDLGKSLIFSGPQFHFPVSPGQDLSLAMCKYAA